MKHQSVVPDELLRDAAGMELPWADQMAYYQVVATEAQTRQIAHLTQALEEIVVALQPHQRDDK